MELLNKFQRRADDRAKKYTGEPTNYRFRADFECPYCGAEYIGDTTDFDGDFDIDGTTIEVECHECERDFYLELSYIPCWNSRSKPSDDEIGGTA